MAVKRAPFQLQAPTVAAPQQRGLTMLQPGFYAQMSRPPSQMDLAPTQRPQVQTLEKPQEQQELPSVGQETPSTEEHFQETVQRIRAQGPAPSLQPGERVKSPNMELVQPSNFRSFYEQLDQVGRIGQQQLATERAKQQFRQMQSLQSILSQGPPGYQTPNLQGQSIGGSVGGLQPWVKSARQEIGSRFGISNIGGHATSGHIKGSDHYTGRALDFMGGKQSLANYAIQNANRLRVKYVIHNGRYWDRNQGWVRYTGSNPHTGHVHVSFY